jgi:hypothetical protein
MKVAQGYYFGEVDMIFGEVRTLSFMADENCTMLSLSKDHFN